MTQYCDILANHKKTLSCTDSCDHPNLHQEINIYDKHELKIYIKSQNSEFNCQTHTEYFGHYYQRYLIHPLFFFYFFDFGVTDIFLSNILML